MILKCNVCKESPQVETLNEPNHDNDLILCPVCNKQMAFATQKMYGRKLIWKPLDTDFSKEHGFAPVSIIQY